MVQVIFGLGMILLVTEMGFRLVTEMGFRIIDRTATALGANLASHAFAAIVRSRN